MNHESTPPPPARAQLLQNLATATANLSGSSRVIPSGEDFYYYRNFDEFKLPIEEIAKQSQSMLESIGSSASLGMAFPKDLDLEDAYDWLVNVNDEVLERVDASVDEFKRSRNKEKEDDEGFQLVCGKKKKGDQTLSKDNKTSKPKVSFHVPSIRKPQEEFNILVNNSNQPFEHVWLGTGDDGHRFLHPLEKLSVLDFIDNGIGGVEPVKPPEIEATPFKLVEEVKDLKELAAKLRGVNEFAVDLEHNQYRSFQGLTCLMQISTRTEDFIVDTLKLRIHIGPYLREVFKDPSKRKVMHGADRDIVWLQRDFGIYICNLFDTGQCRSQSLKLSLTLSGRSLRGLDSPPFRFVNMFTSRKKIHKDKDAEPTEFEESVAQSIFDLENTNQELKSDLKDLYINSAALVDVAGNRKAVVIHVPYRLRKAYRKIHVRLVRELEKKFSGKDVILIATRRIVRPPKKGSAAQRPRTRTLTAVHEAILEDVVLPAEIVGKRTRYRLDGSKIMKVFLDPKERNNTEYKLESFSAVYRKLSGKDVVFEYPITEA